MRPEVRDQFLANADAIAKGLGGSSFQEGIEMARKALAFLTQLFDSIQTPELFAKGLDELQLTNEQENLLVQGIAAAPLLLRWLAKDFIETTQETLPALPNRRPRVSAKNQLEILGYVNKLNFQQRVPLEIAKQRAAIRFHCSTRTVERYWHLRQEILENGPKYQFGELLDALKTAFAESVAEEQAERTKLTGAERTSAAPQAGDHAIR